MQEQLVGFPLSLQQTLLWALQRDGQVPPAQCAILLEGSLKINLLKKALGKVAERYEILRTTFHRLPGMNLPVQVISDGAMLSYSEMNLSDYGAQDQEDRIKEALRQQRHRAFDIQQGPLIFALLLALSEKKHLLVITLPALCADSSSLKNLAEQIANSYAPEEVISDEPLQYAQISEWQNEMLEDERSEAGQAFWRKLQMPALKLPFAVAPERETTFEPQSLRQAVSPDVAAELAKIADRHGTTITIVLLSAWATLLWRLAGQPRFAINKLFDGRKYEDLQTAIGPLARWLPVAFHFEDKLKFSEVIARVHESVSDAQDWQEYFAAEESGEPEGNRGHSVGFEFEQWPSKLSAGDVSFSVYDRFSCFDQLNLKLSCVQTEDCLITELRYDSGRLSPIDIERLAGEFHKLLVSAASDSEAAIDELDLLSDAERRRLLIDFNRTASDFPEDKSIAVLFEQQVTRSADSIAVVFEGKQLTYFELNARANRLAHHLQALGVGPETLVGVCLERSVEMVVGLLGILKAGGAYVPIDASYPKDRLAFMLEDAQVKALLTERRLSQSLPECAAKLVFLDSDWETIAGQGETNPISAATADNLAYVIYTSGSTGKPKGVMIPHRGLTNYLSWCAAAYQVSDGQGSPVHSPIGFDLTVTSLFAPLLSGKSVVLVSEEKGVEGLSDALRSGADFSLVKVTPQHLGLLSQWLPPKEAAGRTKILVIGGEALYGESLSFWRAHAPATRLINEYGPTETVVGCCVYESPPEETITGAVPIGRPIANTQIYLLDEHLQPVPVGAPGELYIGGVGVARGYLNRPGLTAERFRPDPFGDQSGARLYKTGDVARHRSDGNIEYLGRNDQQVKLRGFRVELGEIETLLSQHPQVREAVVMAREDRPDHKRLVAYVIPERAAAPTVSELRAYLQEKLPDHMVPAAFVVLDTLPLTPNGKLDRRRLPAPDFDRPRLKGSFAPPRTPVEERLVEIWSQVLKVNQVGIHDNFFELGGDSILVFQAAARANQMGLGLLPKHFFERQTIADLAAVAGDGLAVQAEQAEVIGPAPLTPIQHWFFEQNLSAPHHFNQAVLLESKERLSPAHLRDAIGHLLRHHDALRLRFTRTEGEWQQAGVRYDGSVPWSEEDLSALDESLQRAAIESLARQMQSSMNLSEGPLLCAAFFDLGEDRPIRLLLIIHHLAVDGVSWRILLEDLYALYKQLSEGHAPLLPPKTTSFQHWANALSEYAQSEEIRQEASYWATRSQRQASRIPVDRSDGPNSVASTSIVRVALSREETRDLIHEAPKAYNTQINDLLLTALTQAFSGWTGTRSLLVDLEGHGREEITGGLDLTRTVGWLTTIFPVLLDLEGVGDAGEAIKTIKEQLRAIPNRGIGYGVLRYLCRDASISAQLQAQPRPEAIFNYLGQLDRSVDESSPFRLAPESAGPTRSPLDVRIHLIEISGGVIGGELHLSWVYSKNIHEPSTIEKLAGDFLKALRSLIAHCLSPQASGYTPSDFPKVRISQQELDELVAKGNAAGPLAPKGLIEDIYPLSSMQEGMLFHTVYAPKAGMFVNQMRCTLVGDLNVAGLKRAWRHVTQRHSVLRTAFFWNQHDEPLQIVFRNVEEDWKEIDWRDISEAEQQWRLDAFLDDDRMRGFDLARAPLMRMCLIRTGEKEHRFAWTYHHLLMDGWSVSMLFKELLTCYEAFANDRAVESQPALPYGDYINWLRGLDLKAAEAYWRKTLEGFTTATPLGIDSARRKAAHERLRYDEERRELSVETTVALRNFARQHHLTLNTVVQGAWGLLLSRYSGRDDVVFGAVVSSRPANLPGIETMLGPVINTVPARVRIKPDVPLIAWLKELQEQQFKQKEYEYTPLVEAHRWSEVPRGEPLFESVLIFENYPVEATLRGRDAGLDVRQVKTLERSNYPLNLIVVPSAKLRLIMPYHSDFFNAARVARMLDQFEHLLRSMIANPEGNVSEMTIIGEEEKDQLVMSFTDDIEVC